MNSSTNVASLSSLFAFRRRFGLLVLLHYHDIPFAKPGTLRNGMEGEKSSGQVNCFLYLFLRGNHRINIVCKIPILRIDLHDFMISF